MEKHYVITWAIDIYADSPEEAAQQALEIQQKSNNDDYIANVFYVKEYKGTQVLKVDLLEHTTEEVPE